MLKIKNVDVQEVAQFLLKLPIKGKASRMRIRLVKKLETHLNDIFIAEQRHLIDNYCIKDDDGNPVMNEDGTFNFSQEGEFHFNKEMQTLYEEDFVLEDTPQNREILSSISSSVLNYDEELTGREAVIHDEICMKIEEAIERF